VVRLHRRESIRSIKTGPDGRFEISDAIERPVVIAELGDQRSAPAVATDKVRLTLAPTSRLEGRVDLAGEDPSHVVVFVRDLSYPITVAYSILAPVAPDGSFALAGVPRHQVRLFAEIDSLHNKLMGGANIAVTGPVVRGLSMSLARSSRVLHVLVRSTVDARLANAQVGVLPGKVASTNALVLNEQFHGGSFRLARQLEGEHAPPQVIGAARTGDLFATMTEVPKTGASTCALAMPTINDADYARKIVAHLDKVPVICVPIPDKADLVIVEVPPMPRLE
jgi:hypothetical protein